MHALWEGKREKGYLPGLATPNQAVRCPRIIQNHCIALNSITNLKNLLKEEALSAFIKPELLSGNNQYECEQCQSKQDAEKVYYKFIC